MNKLFIQLGAILCFLAVILGAFGAHALKNTLMSYQIANQYHFYHGLGMIIVGLLMNWFNRHGHPTLMLKISGWVMFSGILLFSGSLYLMAVYSITNVGFLTPIGGICLILSWLLITITITKKHKP